MNQSLEQRIIELEKKVAALEGLVQEQRKVEKVEVSLKEKLADAPRRLREGKATINQLREEVGLKALEGREFNTLFTTMLSDKNQP